MDVNENINDIKEKIQHLSMNHAGLLGEMERLRKEVALLGKKQVNKRKTIRKKKKDIL